MGLDFVEATAIDKKLLERYSVWEDVFIVKLPAGEIMYCSGEKYTYNTDMVLMVDNFKNTGEKYGEKFTCTKIRQILRYHNDRIELNWIRPNQNLREYAEAHNAMRVSVPGGIPPLVYKGTVAVPDYEEYGNDWYLMDESVAQKLTRDFSKSGNAPTGYNPSDARYGNKSKAVAAVLAFFFGMTGAHRYYLGYHNGFAQTCGFLSLIIYIIVRGVEYISIVGRYYMDHGHVLYDFRFIDLFLLYGIFVYIWVFVDFIRILTGSLAPNGYDAYKEDVPLQMYPNYVNNADNNKTETAVVDRGITPESKTEATSVDNQSISEKLEILEKLGNLYKNGILTEEEFQKKKEDILKTI